MKTAIIMAAGFGSRLMPITKDKPKTMVKVNGEAMIDNIIDQINENGFDEIIVVTGYLSNKLKNHLEKKFPKVRLVENIDYETTNNLYSFLMAAKFAKGDVLFMNSDLYFDKGFISELLVKNISAIAVRQGEWNDENMKVITDNNQKAIGISKLYNEEESFAVSCDTYYFKSELFKKFVKIAEEVKKGDLNAWTEVAIHEMIKDNPIDVVNTIKYDWYEIDNLDDLENASIIFSKNKNIFSEYDTYIYDLDGTLYRDGKAIEGAAKVINDQISKNKNVYVITNNSADTADGYFGKLKNLGFNIKKENIINSSIPTIAYIKSNDLEPSYIFGTKSFVNLAASSLTLTNDINSAKSIVIGNNQEFNFDTLTILLSGVQTNKDAAIIATNPDILYPLKDGTYTIDCGTIVKIVERISGREAKIIGKPNAEIINGVIKGKTILFGDRIYTDMKCAMNAGIDSCLVMSGEADIIAYENKSIEIKKIINSINF